MRIVFACLSAALLLPVPAFSQQGQQRGGSRPGIYGQCPGASLSAAPTVDPAYSRLAEATGGQVFNLRGADLDKMAAVMEARLIGNKAEIVLAHGVLRDPAPREWQIPVDSSSKSVTFSVTVELKCSAAVLRPSGSPVSRQEPNVQITELASGHIVRVRQAEPGIWRVRVSGFGKFSVDAAADSDLRLDSFQFVRLGGRPGHEGLFPIAGQPLAGSSHLVRANLNGSYRSAAFRLLSEFGEAIQEVNLTRAPGADEYNGPLDLPTTAFRFAVVGYDESGIHYQRVYPQLFRAQTVEVTAVGTPEEAPAGSTTEFFFEVRNLGPRGSFHVVAADSHGLSIRAEPGLVTLDTGASAGVRVRLVVLAGTPDGTGITVTAAATSAADANLSNGVSVSLTARQGLRP